MKLHRFRSLSLLSALCLVPFIPATAALAVTATDLPEVAHYTLEDLENGNSDFIVALAEDKIITVPDLNEELVQLRQGVPSGTWKLNFPEYVREAANRLINNVLIVKDFEKDGKRRIPDSAIDEYITGDIQKSFNGDRLKFLHYLNSKGETLIDYRKSTKEKIIFYLMETQLRSKNPVVSPAMMEEYFKANPDKFVQDDAVRYRKLEFGPKDGETEAQLLARAQAVADRIKAGEPFAAVASELQPRAPKTGDNDLEWTKLSEIAPAFATAIGQQAKGGMTAPLLTEGSPKACFIFLVVDRRYKGPLTLEQASPEIENDLKRQLQDEAYRKWIGQLREKFFWRIY